MVALMSVPMFAAYGWVYDGGWGYAPFAILTFLPFLVVPSVIGSAITLVLVNVFPARRTRDILSVVAILAAAGLVLLFRLLRPEKLARPEGFRSLVDFIAVLRTFAALLAGANRMPWGSFLFYNAAGAIGWAGGYAIAAYWLGRRATQLAGATGIVVGPSLALNGGTLRDAAGNNATLTLNSLGATSAVKVDTVEHLMAALVSLGIDNVIVELNSPEVPIMDGSAAPFVLLLQQAGTKIGALQPRTADVREQIKRPLAVDARDARNAVELLPGQHSPAG